MVVEVAAAAAGVIDKTRVVADRRLSRNTDCGCWKRRDQRLPCGLDLPVCIPQCWLVGCC